MVSKKMLSGGIACWHMPPNLKNHKFKYKVYWYSMETSIMKIPLSKRPKHHNWFNVKLLMLLFSICKDFVLLLHKI